MRIDFFCICSMMMMASVSTLVYPGNLGVVQFLCGYGIAVDNLEELENVLTGAIFRVSYPLPTMLAEQKNIKKRQDIKRKDIAETKKFREDNSFEAYRWIFYKAIELIAENHGFAGKACLLRSICESAETPFHHKNGLLAELLHVVLTPSSSIDAATTDVRYLDYMAAEHWGENGANCSIIYKECVNSILEQFTIKAV